MSQNCAKQSDTSKKRSICHKADRKGGCRGGVVVNVALDRSGLPVAGSEALTQIGIDPHALGERAGAGARLSTLRHLFLRSSVHLCHLPAQNL